MFKFVLDKFYKILSPPRCEYCYVFLKDYNIFCNNCFAKITPVISCMLQVTSKYTMSVYAASDYKYPLKKLILAKIFSNRLASKQLAQIIWKRTNISNMDFDYIIPVPLHWTRYAKRGFNQAEVMAQELSKLSGKPVANIVRRNKKTMFQSLLLSHQRRENLKNAFELKNYNMLTGKEINLSEYENKKLLIVDDLMTTGATLVNLAKELKKLKPSEIIASVGCRTI